MKTLLVILAAMILIGCGHPTEEHGVKVYRNRADFDSGTVLADLIVVEVNIHNGDNVGVSAMLYQKADQSSTTGSMVSSLQPGYILVVRKLKEEPKNADG